MTEDEENIIGFCDLCMKEIRLDTKLYLCSCQIAYHRDCIAGLGECPNCNSKIVLPPSETGVDENVKDKDKDKDTASRKSEEKAPDAKEEPKAASGGVTGSAFSDEKSIPLNIQITTEISAEKEETKTKTDGEDLFLEEILNKTPAAQLDRKSKIRIIKVQENEKQKDIPKVAEEMPSAPSASTSSAGAVKEKVSEKEETDKRDVIGKSVDIENLEDKDETDDISKDSNPDDMEVVSEKMKKLKTADETQIYSPTPSSGKLSDTTLVLAIDFNSLITRDSISSLMEVVKEEQITSEVNTVETPPQLQTAPKESVIKENISELTSPDNLVKDVSGDIQDIQRPQDNVLTQEVESVSEEQGKTDIKTGKMDNKEYMGEKKGEEADRITTQPTDIPETKKLEKVEEKEEGNIRKEKETDDRVNERGNEKVEAKANDIVSVMDRETLSKTDTESISAETASETASEQMLEIVHNLISNPLENKLTPATPETTPPPAHPSSSDNTDEAQSEDKEKEREKKEEKSTEFTAAITTRDVLLDGEKITQNIKDEQLSQDKEDTVPLILPPDANAQSAAAVSTPESKASTEMQPEALLPEVRPGEAKSTEGHLSEDGKQKPIEEKETESRIDSLLEKVVVDTEFEESSDETPEDRKDNVSAEPECDKTMEKHKELSGEQSAEI
ncbi:MAG: hypothetical protein QW728_00600, partial [Thermoplasmata archaeon]